MSALRAVPDSPTDDEPEQPVGDAADRRYLIMDGPSNVAWLRGELGTPNMPGVFLRGGRLVYVASITDAGYVQPRHPEDDNGPATVAPLSALGLSTRIGDNYQIERWDKKSKKPKPAHFPNEDCARVMETVEALPHVRTLRGVTHTPVVRRDKGLLTQPGYDPDSHYLLEPTVDVDPPAGAPTEAQVKAATKYLRNLLADFVWADPDSEANFFGCMLTPLLRLACPPPYKLAAITARERGSGKSMLAELLRIVHGGSLSTWPSSDDELEKFISSTLHCTTAPIVQVDNVRGTLASGRLEALATSNTYAVRVLGSTNKHTLANDRLWVFTGNNMVIGGDLGRRMLWIDIDPGVEKPELRTGFRIADLPRHVARERGKVLKALLTWCAAWDAQGRPVGEATSDNYGRWVASVRSILSIAGVPGTFDSFNTERDAVVNPDEAEWGDFLLAVHRTFGTTTWTTKDLTERMATPFATGSAGESLLESLPSELHEKAARSGARSIHRSLGMWLAFRKGQWHSGCTVTENGLHGTSKARLWAVTRRDDKAA